MIETPGQVTAVNQRNAWVHPLPQTACAACCLRSSCGQPRRNAYRASPQRVILSAAHSQQLHQGNQVVIGMAESTLLKAAFLVYLLPLLAMMLSFWLANLLQVSELAGLVIGAIGLIVGLAPARLGHCRFGHQYQAQVMRIMDVDNVGGNTIYGQHECIQ